MTANQSHSDKPVTDTEIAFFPRWLPVVGLVIGVVYLLTLQIIDGAFGPGPAKLEFELYHLPEATSLQPSQCDLEAQTVIPIEDHVSLVGKDANPDIYALKVAANESQTVLALGSIVDKAELISCQPAGASQAGQSAGDMLPFSTRPIQTPEIAFELEASGEVGIFLLEITQGAPVALPVSVLERSAFFENADRRTTIHIAFISAIGFMIVYNMVLAGLVNMPAFVFNALSIGSMLLLDLYMSGIGAAYLWPERPELSNVFLAVSLAGPTLFGPFYIYRFIVAPEKRLLNAKPWLLAWPALSVLGLTASFVIPYGTALQVITGLWITLGFVSLYHLFRSFYRGNPRAGVLLVALLGAAAPAMIAGAAKEYGGWQFGSLAPHTIELALLLEALLFTLALAYQMRLSKWRELDALQSLNRQAKVAKRNLLETIDVDRTRLASDLHDSAGQMLVLISSRLKQAALKSDEAGSELSQTAAYATEALAEIRRIAHDLHPATLAHLGLEKALEGLCSGMAEAGALRISTKLDFDVSRLNDREILQIYRISQELLNNVVRHSGANDAELELMSRGDKFQLKLSDNGHRTDVSRTRDEATGIGRTILRERVERLDGVLSEHVGAMGTTTKIEFTVNRSALTQEVGSR